MRRKILDYKELCSLPLEDKITNTLNAYIKYENEGNLPNQSIAIDRLNTFNNVYRIKNGINYPNSYMLHILEKNGLK